MTGDSLRDIRRALGMTQDELADRWGLRGRQTISEWERGVYPVPEWVRDALDGIAAVMHPDPHARMGRLVAQMQPGESLHRHADRWSARYESEDGDDRACSPSSAPDMALAGLWVMPRGTA